MGAIRASPHHSNVIISLLHHTEMYSELDVVLALFFRGVSNVPMILFLALNI